MDDELHSASIEDEPIQCSQDNEPSGLAHLYKPLALLSIGVIAVVTILPLIGHVYSRTVASRDLPDSTAGYSVSSDSQVGQETRAKERLLQMEIEARERMQQREIEAQMNAEMIRAISRHSDSYVPTQFFRPSYDVYVYNR